MKIQRKFQQQKKKIALYLREQHRNGPHGLRTVNNGKAQTAAARNLFTLLSELGDLV